MKTESQSPVVGAAESMRPSRLSLAMSLLSLAWVVCFSGGCAGYRFGSQTLYNPNLRTVYVPMVRNDSWRHDINQQLTEALVKAIELQTPYKVVANPNADSTLTCRVIMSGKRTVTEAITDEPRAIEDQMTVQLTWTDRRGNLLFTNRFLPEGELAYHFTHATDFVPEGGQSLATAQQRTIERLADQIVQQMEMRW